MKLTQSNVRFHGRRCWSRLCRHKYKSSELEREYRTKLDYLYKTRIRIFKNWKIVENSLIQKKRDEWTNNRLNVGNDHKISTSEWLNKLDYVNKTRTGIFKNYKLWKIRRIRRNATNERTTTDGTQKMILKIKYQRRNDWNCVIRFVFSCVFFYSIREVFFTLILALRPI